MNPAALALALTIFLAPTLGVPFEELLQDTLKSMVVAFGALMALLLLGWQMRRAAEPVRLHRLLWLPLVLLAYALCSMLWSHTYLAGGEAIRWSIFAVLLAVSLQVLNSRTLPWLVAGIHWGAIMACLWAGLQFWLDFKGFVQGPNPASTFVNRNFFAEYAVFALPFSLWLAVSGRGVGQVALRSGLLGFHCVAILLTGTRSALLAMIAIALVVPVILIRYRAQIGCAQWSVRERWSAVATLAMTVLVLGLAPCGNADVLNEHSGSNALQRAFQRTASMAVKEEYTERSFSVRYVMWQATARMIHDNPLKGVGAGAWEVEVPLYQRGGAQLETDYYAHNEFLQLIAEYGVVGWLWLAVLLGYLCTAAWTTWKRVPPGPDAKPTNTTKAGKPRVLAQTQQGEWADAPFRAVVLTALLALLIVSNAGFPWRMASTGALFALCLAMLAASDVRQLADSGARADTRSATGEEDAPQPWRWTFTGSLATMLVALLGLLLAGVISWKAVVAERDLVTAAKIALTISQSEDPNAPVWDRAKQDMLAHVRHGIDINPHYRKLTPITADELARWGDWKNATWIWESVVRSRPYVVVILANIARGHAQAGNMAQAEAYLKLARAVAPDAITVQSFEIVLLSRSGQEPEAARRAKVALQTNRYDFDLVNAAYVLGMRLKDWPLALDALQRRSQRWPELASEGWLKTAEIYASPEVNDPAKARLAYQAAVLAAPADVRKDVLAAVPLQYRGK